MTDAREDNEILAGAPPEEKYLEPADSADEFIVNMEKQSVFRPDAFTAAEVPAELAPLLERAYLFLEDGEWAKADAYCERVLDKSPRVPLAYLGKFMAEKHVRTREELPNVPIDLEGDRNYSKAVRFASPELADLLKRYALTGRSPKKQRRVRRIVAAALTMLVCCAVAAGTAAAVWYGKLLPEKTYAAEIAALENAVIGDTVVFGSYRNPAEWTVLEKNADSVLLLSRRAVATSRYNDSSTDTTWKKSDIRLWLNETYYSTAFGKQEQKLIQTTEIDETPSDRYDSHTNDVYPDASAELPDGYYYDDEEGVDFLSYAPAAGANEESAKDKLFLLNLAELNLHLKTDGEKRCLAALPAQQKTAEAETPVAYTGWWLRTQTGEGMPACYIDEDGAAQYDYYGEDPELGVRPAMWVNIDTSQ